MNFLRGGIGAMDGNLFELLQVKKEENEVIALVASNEKTEKFGLQLTRKEAKELVVCRNQSLKKYKRVEFGEGILDNVIYAFCDSQYIHSENYLETLQHLQDMFYEFKNETGDKMTDDELLTFMREQFENICYGDLEYLESTCLDRLATAVKSGYRGFQKTGGYGEYEELSEEQRWDNDLYMQVVKELFW